MSQKILAVSYNSKKLGAAYYDEDDCKVHILHDIAENEDFSTFSSCMHKFIENNIKSFLNSGACSTTNAYNRKQITGCRISIENPP